MTTPTPPEGRIATEQRGHLLLAVDVSGSMDYPDMRWQGQTVSRLSLVQTLLGDFIASRQGDRLGLVLFGSRAYLQAPLTFDRQTVRTWLAQAHLVLKTAHILHALPQIIARHRALQQFDLDVVERVLHRQRTRGCGHMLCWLSFRCSCSCKSVR